MEKKSRTKIAAAVPLLILLVAGILACVLYFALRKPGKPALYTVTVLSSDAGRGTVSPGGAGGVPGGTIVTADGDVLTLAAETPVLITAKAGAGCRFAGFRYGDAFIDGSGNTKVSGDMAVLAVFEEKKTVSVSTEKQSFVYDGAAHAFTVRSAPDGLDGFRAEYKKEGEYAETAPVDSGLYDVRVTRAEDELYRALSVELPGALEIEKAVPVLSAPGIIESLVHSGGALALVTPGSTDRGKILYSKDGETYDESVPEGTDEGKYKVWYKIKGDENCADAGPFGPLECAICSDGLTYAPSGDGYMITASGNTNAVIRIPARHRPSGTDEEKPVVSIGEGVFKDNLDLNEVEIPYTVSDIGDEAFSGCLNLSVIGFGNTEEYPSGLKSIGARAFENCCPAGLAIPASVESIGTDAFAGCAFELKSITVDPRNAKYADGRTAETAPSGNCLLERDTGVLLLGCAATVFPGTVSKIANGAFSFCKDLVSAEIPDSVTDIGDSAFAGCESLRTVRIPASAERVGNMAFYFCTELSEVKIQTAAESTLAIGDSAFKGCAALSSVEIPSSVSKIGKKAFSGCLRLTCAGFGTEGTESKLESIGEGAFSSCSCLAEVHVSDLSAWCGTEFGDAFANPLTSARNLYVNGKEIVESLVLPDGVQNVGKYAFCNCDGVLSLTIPSSVESIGDDAFTGCERLYEVINKSDMALEIGDAGNGGVAANAKVISDKNGAKTYAAPYDGENRHLEIVECVEGKLIFSRIAGESGTTFRLEAYVGDADTVTLPEKITADGAEHAYAMYRVKGLRGVVIPAGIARIDAQAFEGCSTLVSIDFGTGVTSIGVNALSECPSLRSVVYGGTMEEFEEAADKHWAARTPVQYVVCADGYVSSDMKNKIAYSDCLEYGPDTAAGGLVLTGTTGNVTDVAVPPFIDGTDGARPVTAIGENAFADCAAAQKILLPSGIVRIEKNAFRGCADMSEIIFNGTAGQWNAVSKAGGWAAGLDPERVSVECTGGVSVPINGLP